LSRLTVKNLKFQKSKMAAAVILKNRKIAISQPRFGRFRPNLARRRSSALLSRLTVKNFKFEKSKMAAAAILKNSKMAISRPRFDRLRPNLARQRSSALLSRLTVKNLKFEKSKMAAAAILKIQKWPYLGRSLTDFDHIWYTDAVRPSSAVRPLKI